MMTWIGISRDALAATKVDQVFGEPVSVEEGDVLPPPSKEEKPFFQQASDYLFSSQEGISDRVIILANEVDSLFGSTRALNEYYQSSLVLTQKAYGNTIGEGSYDIQTNLNLNLPNWRRAEEGFRRWWSGESEDEPEERVTRKEYKELNPWKFNPGLNVRFSRPLAMTLNGRLSKDFLTGPVVNHFYQQVGWDSDHLWESVTSLTSDYALSRQWLFRFLNEADWEISNRLFNSFHGPSFVHTINKTSLTSWDFRLVTATENNNFYTDNYTAGFTYRTALRRWQWMFFQITPELSWPRRERFTAVWTLNLTLDMVFGNRKL